MTYVAAAILVLWMVLFVAGAGAWFVIRTVVDYIKGRR